MGLSPPRGGDRGARVPSRRDRSSHDAPTATTASAVCLAIFADAPLARAPRPYPRVSRAGRRRRRPSFVASPRGFAAAADAAEDRPPSDLDATPTPSRASTDDRPDASPTPRVTAPLDRHPTDENDGRDPDRARDREFRATPPASSSSRPPRPPRLVDVRRRALRRDSKLTLDALRVAGRRRRTSSNPPTSPRSVSNSATARASNGIVGARTRTTTPPSARSPARWRESSTRSIRRTTRERSFGCSTASRRSRAPRGRTRRPPARQSRPRRGRGHRALRGRRARRDGDSRAGGSRARVRALRLWRRTWRRCSGPRVG